MALFVSRSRLIRKTDDILLLIPDSGQRTMLLLIFSVIASAMVFGLDLARDFSGSRLMLTICAFAILLAVLVMSGRIRIVEFDKARENVSVIRKLFGIQVGELESISQHLIQSVTLQKFDLKRSRNEFKRTGILGNLLESRSVIFRLFLDEENGRVDLFDGDSGPELEKMGLEIAKFMGIPFEREEAGDE